MRFFKLAVAAAVMMCSAQVFAETKAPVASAAAVPQVSAKKILVVYYSRTGNTKKVAEDIARGLNADIERIIDKKDRSGAGGYLKAGRDATKERLTDIAPIINNPAKYDLIVIGTPVWGWNMTPAVRAYITGNKASFKEAAFFTTAGGTKPDRIVGKMETLAGLKTKTFTGFFAGDFKEGNRAVYDKKLSGFIEGLK